MMTANLNLQKKLGNEQILLSLMPLELWRLVDGFTDAKSHTFLRTSCSFFRTWLTWEKDVEFEDYVKMFEKTESMDWRVTFRRTHTFQSAVHLNPRTLKQDHYVYLCRVSLFLEVFRICRFALQEPFSCAHIDLGARSNYAIREASELGHYHEVKLLLQDPKVDPAADDNRAIRNASHFEHLAVVGILLQDPRVNPAACNNDAFRYASYDGHLAVVELLLQDPRVDPAEQDNWAIRFASQNGHLAVVQLLLYDTRVDPTASNNESLRNASIRNLVEICNLLLSDHRVLAAYFLHPFELPAGCQVPLSRASKDINAGPSGSKADRRRIANVSR